MDLSFRTLTNTTPCVAAQTHVQQTKSEIICVSSITKISERLLVMPKGSFVFVDLDETLWFHSGISIRSELSQGGYYSCIGTCIYKLVEEQILTIISDLKKKDIYVLALTKRGSEAKVRIETLNNLKKLGVIFSKIFPEFTKLKETAEDISIYEEGVVFASDFSKDAIMLEILIKAQELKISPPEIALIEDLEEIINDTQKALENRIPFLGIHYTAAKEIVHEKENEEEIVAFKNLFLEMHRSLKKK